MKEKLLQYIWQFQYFNKSDLVTTGGESLQVMHCGNLNTNQGPDFLQGKIKINKTLWAGNIELHINASDWNLHKHHHDENYNNVILHVVWNYDMEIKDASGNIIPALELKNLVSKILLNRYEAFMNANTFIPCQSQIHTINPLTFINWKQRILVERLENKSSNIFKFLQENNFHWEETFWWLIARNFGIKINSDAFENIARSIPIATLAKHKNQIHQIEALLFGQAGLLEKDFDEDYPAMLKKEYKFYAAKYKLKPIRQSLLFLRMRPSNFPTIRLAQLAMLIHKSEHLFSKIKESNSLHEIKNLLNVTANDYWHYHYIFDESSDYKIKKLGEQMINNILINTVVPILFSYGFHQNEHQYKDKAIKWLEEIMAEKNAITKGFEALLLTNKTAADSQSFIQLKNEYCNNRRCLECAVGNALLRG